MATLVKFLIDNDPTAFRVFGYFPGLMHDKKYNLSYSTVGQHCPCSKEYANGCKEATPEQYADLKSELESIGYDLKIV